LLRRAHRARRAARFLSSLTVIVGIVIRRYYHVRQRRSSRAIRRTNSRTSRQMGGRDTRGVYVQCFATNRRCERSSVAGVTRKVTLAKTRPS
jgi:hypothetical protein